MPALDHKTAIVTGSSRGLGAAIARQLAGLGADVSLAARDEKACTEAADEINGAGGTAMATACDVGEADNVERLVAATIERFGGLDILVNNASIIEPIGAIDEALPADWAANVTINLLGVYHGVRAVLPGFRANGGGVIVNISSGAAHAPLEGWSPYCAAKAAVAMLTRSIDLECASDGIRVYGLAPGTIDTDMQGTIRASGINPISRIPKEKLGSVSVPARIAAWLCTEDAADLAGHELDAGDHELRRRAGIEG